MRIEKRCFTTQMPDWVQVSIGTSPAGVRVQLSVGILSPHCGVRLIRVAQFQLSANLHTWTESIWQPSSPGKHLWENIRKKGWMPDKSKGRFHVGHIEQLFSLVLSATTSKEVTKASSLPVSIVLSVRQTQSFVSRWKDWVRITAQSFLMPPPPPTPQLVTWLN